MAFLDETGLAELWSLIDQKHAKVVTGSYTGTGTYGRENPCTITLDFVPKLVVLFSGNYHGFLYQGCAGAVFLARALMYSSATAVPTTSSTAYSKNTVAWSSDGKTVSWYADYSAAHQYNTSGTTFRYIAIG